MQEMQVPSLGWEDPLEEEKKWKPIPVFLLGESHGQRSRVGYSPRGPKELDTHACVHSVAFFPILSHYGLSQDIEQFPVLYSRALLFIHSKGKWSQLLQRLVNYHAWRRQWHPTPVLLPGKSHGWRSLVGCSPWGCEESDTTE